MRDRFHRLVSSGVGNGSDRTLTYALLGDRSCMEGCRNNCFILDQYHADSQALTVVGRRQ